MSRKISFKGDMTLEIFLTKKINVFLLSLLAMFLWGSAFPVLKISYELLGIESYQIYPKIYFAGIRFFWASILVFLISRFIFKTKIKLKREDIIPIMVLGFLQTAVQYFFFYVGVGNTSGIKSSILQSSGAFFIVIFSHFTFKDDKMNILKLASMFLGFLGIIAININSDFDFTFSVMGEGFLLISAIVSAIATIIVRKIAKGINPIILTGSQMFFGSILLFAIGKYGMDGEGLVFEGGALYLLIYGVFISAVAFLIWYMLLTYNKPGEISFYRFFIPVFGTILSAIFIEEDTFTFYTASGLFLVVSGMIVLHYKGFVKGIKENFHKE